MLAAVFELIVFGGEVEAPAGLRFHLVLFVRLERFPSIRRIDMLVLLVPTTQHDLQVQQKCVSRFAT